MVNTMGGRAGSCPCNGRGHAMVLASALVLGALSSAPALASWTLTPHAAALVARNRSLLGTCLPCCNEPPPGEACCCPGGCVGGCPGCPPLPPSCPPPAPAKPKGAQLVPATHDSVRWQGRTLRDGRTGTVAYAWAGVSFSFNVTATTAPTTVAMQFSSGFPNTHLAPCTGAVPACGAAGLHVYVDGVLKNNLTLPMGGAAWPNNTGATTWIALLDDFQCGAPSCVVQGIYIADPITLSWPNLPAFDRQTTHAFRVGGGGITPQPPVSKQQRRIDIYGDSITAGNQINPDTCDHDWSGTYGKLLCQGFGANCTCQAISGKGIYHNCCDNGVTMNEIGLNILPGEPAVAAG